MPNPMTVILRALALGVPLALGGLAVAMSGDLRQTPAPKEVSRPATAMRVLTLAPVPLVPRISGFGTVQPVRDWRAVARLEGEVLETAPDLANGQVVSGGSVLLRLDDTDLRLSLAQIAAQQAALEIKQQTLAASHSVVLADLDLARAELARQEKLVQEGVATQARLDTARRAELAARAKVVEQENQQALTRAEADVLAAQRALVERSLGFVTVTAPYDLRITDVQAELGQVVSKGQTLLTGEGVEAAEVAAQFPIGRIGPVLRSMGQGATVADLTALVRLPVPDHPVEWVARVDRVGDAIDPLTQSTAIVVRIDDPLGQAQAGQRPPLRRNTFVEVVLSAPKRPALLAPAEAVQGGTAFVVTPEGILEKRPVTLGLVQGDLAVITGGLVEGDRLVVSDPALAVPGMTVKPVEDAALAAQLAALALRQAPGAAPKPGSGQGGGKGAGKGGDQ